LSIYLSCSVGINFKLSFFKPADEVFPGKLTDDEAKAE